MYDFLFLPEKKRQNLRTGPRILGGRDANRRGQGIYDIRFSMYALESKRKEDILTTDCTDKTDETDETNETRHSETPTFFPIREIRGQ